MAISRFLMNDEWWLILSNIYQLNDIFTWHTIYILRLIRVKKLGGGGGYFSSNISRYDYTRYLYLLSIV